MTIKRRIIADLVSHLNKPEITLLIGPRQVGKTTLLRSLQDHLRRSGQPTLFLSLDHEPDRKFFTSQLALINCLQSEFGSRPGTAFIDEIQMKENAGIFLKGIYDQNLPYKLVVSGSGSLELKEKIHESLMGRKRIFTLYPLSFPEFVDLRTEYRYSDRLPEYFSIQTDYLRQYLQEYLNFGGYPKVVLQPTLAEKRQTLSEIYTSFLEKDLSYLLGIKKTAHAGHLVRLIASQIGQPVVYSELSSTIGLDLKTLRNYLWYLEKIFVLAPTDPFFKNIRKEITKSPLYYFLDLGLRNFARDILGQAHLDSQAGLLFQNFIHNHLLPLTELSPTHVRFWRTTDGAEVDFVLERGPTPLPIEVKYQDLKKPVVPRSLKSFIRKYHPPTAYIINLSLDHQVQVDTTKVVFLPYFHLDRLSDVRINL